MAVPAIAGAMRNKEDMVKMIFYAFVGIAVLYFLYKLFKALEKVKKVDDAVKEAVTDVKEKVVEYTKEAKKLPKDIVEGIAKPVVEHREKDTPGGVEAWEKNVWSALDVLGAPALVETGTSSNTVVPRYVSMEEYKDLQAKRWEAIAKYYQKEEKIHHLPVKRVLPIRTPIHAL